MTHIALISPSGAFQGCFRGKLFSCAPYDIRKGNLSQIDNGLVGAGLGSGEKMLSLPRGSTGHNFIWGNYVYFQGRYQLQGSFLV